MRPSLRPCIPFLFLGALPFSAAFRTLPHHHQGAAGGPIAGKRGPCPNMAMSASGASSCPIFKGGSKEDIALAADAPTDPPATSGIEFVSWLHAAPFDSGADLSVGEQVSADMVAPVDTSLEALS